MVFYFTGTGNSLYVAKKLDKERISIAQSIHDEKKNIKLIELELYVLYMDMRMQDF